ncbi:MAG: cytochrome c maturation protein CcmE [Actinomycetota bacterium]
MRSRVRFIIAICMAVGLAGVLGVMSLKGNQQTYASPGALVAGKTYRLNATVAPGAPADAAARAQTAEGLRFTVRDKANPGTTIDVVYRGSVPDTFKVGRDIVVVGKLEDGVFQAQRNSMIAQCPSKFQAKADEAAHSGSR